MRKASLLVLFLVCSLFSSCTVTTLTPTPSILSVYATAAAEPWLNDLYNCAAEQPNIVLSRVDDASSAQIALRVGEPEQLNFAYQIDREEILIITHRQSAIQNLTLDEARALFAGQGDPSVQVWVYAPGADVQESFDQFVMAGRSVTPAARIAVHPQQMSDTLVNESNAVGILPGHWKVGDVREVLTVATVPVLAITNSEPQGGVKELIACLQK